MKNIATKTALPLILGLSFFFGTSSADAQHYGCPALRVAYCGCEGLSLRCGPGTSYHKHGVLYHGTQLIPTGESRWSCGVLWQKVSVKGLMQIGCGCSGSLTQTGYGHWTVNKTSSMYSSPSAGTHRLGKIYCGTRVQGCHQQYGYLYAHLDGWVAVRTASGKVYVH